MGKNQTLNLESGLEKQELGKSFFKKEYFHVIAKKLNFNSVMRNK